MRTQGLVPVVLLLATLLGGRPGLAAGPTRVEPARTGDVEILSNTGSCTIILDGGKQVVLSCPRPDGPAQGRFTNVTPGRHHIQVKSFFVWHDSTIDVEAGEVLEIRVEPRSFRITTRDGC